MRFNITVVPMATGLFLVVYCAVQFLGERLGFAPVINLSAPGGFTMGESILMFVLILALSNAVTLNLAFYLIRKARKPRKNSSGSRLVFLITFWLGLVSFLIYLSLDLVLGFFQILTIPNGLFLYFESITWWIGTRVILQLIALNYAFEFGDEIAFTIKKRKEAKKDGEM